MMKRFWQVIFLVMCMAFSTLQAQPTPAYTSRSKKAIKLYEESTNYFVRRQYTSALELLQKAVARDRNFAEAHLRLAKIYATTGNYPYFQQHLEKVLQNQYDNPAFSEAHALLAKHYFHTGKYGEAEKLARQLLSMPRAPKVMRTDARQLLQNISFTQEAIKHPLPFHPRPVDSILQQMPLQYFPVLTVDQQQMIFTGRQGASPQYDEDIYISTKDNAGNWTLPQPLSDRINTPLNEGTCTISADGRTLIFTSCETRGGFGSCDLYITRKTGDTWSTPQNLGPQINTRAWESQPSLSADGNTLYFVSDRSGGLGRRDLYIAHRDESGTWKPAENLGPSINTELDEVSPFIHVNGQTLYFSSDGRPGFGSFDLYVSEKTDADWTTPRNLGYPINTSDDQSGLFITANGRDAYYSQETRAHGEYMSSRLYTFVIPEAIRVTNRSSYVKGIVRDASSRKPLEATVELIDLKKQKKISQVSSDPVSGEYMMVLTEGSEYALYVDREDYLFQSLTFNYAADTQKIRQPVAVDVFLQPIEKGKETVLNNIFFDTDQYTIQEKSRPELDKVVHFLQSNPDLRIAINGHTDNVGDAAYNQNLSLNRAKAVRDYLIAAGISPDRISSQGYGQNRPVASNNTAEGRQQNRRIAFEIL